MTRYLVAPFMVVAIGVACAGDAGESRGRLVRDRCQRALAQRFDVLRLYLHRFDGAGDLVDTLGVYPGFEVYMVPSQGGIPSTYQHPISRATYFQFLPDGYYVADNDTYEIQKYAPDGKLQQIVRRLTTPVQVEPQHMQTLLERALAAVTDDNRCC